MKYVLLRKGSYEGAVSCRLVCVSKPTVNKDTRNTFDSISHHKNIKENVMKLIPVLFGQPCTWSQSRAEQSQVKPQICP